MSLCWSVRSSLSDGTYAFAKGKSRLHCVCDLNRNVESTNKIQLNFWLRQKLSC
jgi:hypothetical protein